MRKAFRSVPLAVLFLLIFPFRLFAQEAAPDTVKTGIYIISIHDIDFKQKEYTTTFWLWLKYKNKDLDFANNLEIPMAKSFTRSFLTVDSSDNKIYMLMKMQCVMKDSWKIGNFPFDKKALRLSIENSQFDRHSCIFVPDTLGAHFDPRFTLNAWDIDSCILSSKIKPYETAFGDETIPKPHTEYSSFRVKLVITRSATGIFWKMFTGMYIAFLIAYVCFYIHPDGIDSRFGLSVGSLFAVIGNKYIIDSALPESSSFTLVDTLHGITLFFIFLIITATAYSLKIVKTKGIKTSMRFDMYAAQIILLLYVALNIYFIAKAQQ